MNSEELSKLVVQGMEDKKAEDIIIMDLRKIKSSISDYIVICSGNSDTQLDAIAESIETVIKKQTEESAWRKEGFSNKEWVLLDYVNVVAHVFKKNRRAYYALEDLWGDAEIIRMNQTTA